MLHIGYQPKFDMTKHYNCSLQGPSIRAPGSQASEGLDSNGGPRRKFRQAWPVGGKAKWWIIFLKTNLAFSLILILDSFGIRPSLRWIFGTPLASLNNFKAFFISVKRNSLLRKKLHYECSSTLTTTYMNPYRQRKCFFGRGVSWWVHNIPIFETYQEW